MIVAILLFIQIFFFPGVLIYFKKEEELAIYIVKIIVTSIAINVFSISLLLLIFNFSYFYSLILNFFLSTAISLSVRFLLIGKQTRSIRKLKFSKWFPFILFLTLMLNFLLLMKYKTIVGADIGRFAIISHALFLKGHFETNLLPYDLAKKFFYFPLFVLIPPFFEILGIDAINFLSFLTFFFSSFFGLPIYLITKKLFDQEIALSSFLFSSILFNPLLNIGFFGVFPYAISTFFFLSFLYILIETNLRDNFILFTSLFDIFTTHIYSLVLVIPFLFTHIFMGKNFFQIFKTKYFWRSFLIFFLFLLPYIYRTFNAIFIPFNKDNKLDILMFSNFNQKLTLTQKISYLLFSTPNGFVQSFLLGTGFFSFIFAVIKFYRKFKESIEFLGISFFLSFILLIILFNDMNFARSLWIMWLFYSIGFALFFSDMRLNLVILTLLALFPLSPSIFSYFILSPTYIQGQIPWIVWNEFYDAIDFIKLKVPLNSTFLIDGGGAGCTGASASYGERIFPLTSRKIFYFSDYCWAEYDKEEYRKRVDLYREISINPNNLDLVKKLKEEYNITHIFIGPTDVGLNKNLFSNSSIYRLIYDDGSYAIFQIL